MLACTFSGGAAPFQQYTVDIVGGVGGWECAGRPLLWEQAN